MHSISTCLAALLISITYAWGQGDLLKEFETNISPSINLLSRQDIFFKWNIAGPDQAAMNEGLNELREDHFGPALANFSIVIQHLPSFYAAYYYRGLCNKFLRKLHDAEKDFQRAIRYNDTLSVAYIELGKIGLATRDANKARSYFEKAARIPPESAGLVALGDFEFVLGHFGKADSLYQTSIALDSAFAEARTRVGVLVLSRTKDTQYALRQFSKALNNDSLQVEALFWRGITLASTKKFPESLKDWNTLVRHYPMQPLFILLRARINTELGQINAAFADLKKFSELAAVNETEFAGLQTATDRRIDLQTVLKYTMRKLYGLSDSSIDAIKAGYCKLLLSQYVPAAESFFEIKEDTELRYYLLGLTYEYMGKHNQAYTSYERAIKINNDIPDVHKKLGIYLLEMQQFSAAADNFTEMIRLEPGQVTGYKFRAIVRTKQGRCDDAIADAEKFIEIDSSDVEAFKARGFCREQLGDFKGACDDYWRAYEADRQSREMLYVILDKYSILVKKDPTYVAAHFRLGQALLETNNIEDGLREIRIAERKGSVEAKEFLKLLKKAIRQYSNR
jgi:tetratricopeptide (TPR) repeat protein